MGYDYTCDGELGQHCRGSVTGEMPAFMGEIREQWFETTQLGGELAQAQDQYGPGYTVTLCGPCLLDLLL